MGVQQKSVVWQAGGRRVVKLKHETSSASVVAAYCVMGRGGEVRAVFPSDCWRSSMGWALLEGPCTSLPTLYETVKGWRRRLWAREWDA